MIKKRVYILIALFSAIFLISSFSAAQNQSSIDKGYQCLTEKVKDKCSTLPIDAQAFSLLALKSNPAVKSECTASLIATSRNSGECWPSNNCNIKATSQAILAISESGGDAKKAERWLLAQNQTSTDLLWYLEVESSNSAECKISYNGREYSIRINEDKTINQGAGSCLSLAEGNYWLRVAPECYNEAFQISCTTGFLTTLLYQRQGSSQIYVSSQVNAASAEGTTTEKINAQCFGIGGRCDYEGSLWATLVLDRDYEINAFIPYLIALTDANTQHLPEAFLWHLTDYSEYYSLLASKQQFNQYWDVSGDKFYDTSLAVLVLQNSKEAQNAKDYFISVQDSNGCWKNDVRNTAFILYSSFPILQPAQPPVIDYCSDQGATAECTSRISCTDSGGSVISGAFEDCIGTEICCSLKVQEKSCSDQAGILCQSNEQCENNRVVPAFDSTGGKSCCLSRCQVFKPVANDCEEFAQGICKSSCDTENEDESSESCPNVLDLCCVEKAPAPGRNYSLLFILILLIGGVVLAILYRQRLQELILRIRSRKQPPSAAPPAAGYRPPFPPPAPSRPIPRRILPQPARQSPQKQATSRAEKELSETLKRLRELGK